MRRTGDGLESPDGLRFGAQRGDRVLRRVIRARDRRGWPTSRGDAMAETTTRAHRASERRPHRRGSLRNRRRLGHGDVGADPLRDDFLLLQQRRAERSTARAPASGSRRPTPVLATTPSRFFEFIGKLRRSSRRSSSVAALQCGTTESICAGTSRRRENDIT